MDDQQHSVEEHISALRRYAFVLAGNSAEADDLVQECLTKALSRVRIWKEIKNVRAFLFTIMHNLHVDWLRKKGNGYSTVPLDSLSEHEAVTNPCQLAAVELTELEWAMTQLPREQRETLALVCLDGMTYREVAEVTKVPLGTVMSRLSRGRETLRRLTSETGAPAAAPKAQRRTDRKHDDRRIAHSCS